MTNYIIMTPNSINAYTKDVVVSPVGVYRKSNGEYAICEETGSPEIGENHTHAYKFVSKREAEKNADLLGHRAQVVKV